MRCKSKRRASRAVSLRGVIGVVATSGLTMSVSDYEGGEKVVDIRISGCYEEPMVGHWRVQYTVPYMGPCDELARAIKETIDIGWRVQNRYGCLQRVPGVDHLRTDDTLVLSDFLHDNTVRQFSADLGAELALHFPGTYMTRRHYKHSLTPHKLRDERERAGLWFHQLRSAGVSEWQIAAYGQGLIRLTARYFDLQGKVDMQQAIFMAVLDMNRDPPTQRELDNGPAVEDDWALLAHTPGAMETIPGDPPIYRWMETPIPRFLEYMYDRKERLLQAEIAARIEAGEAKRDARAFARFREGEVSLADTFIFGEVEHSHQGAAANQIDSPAAPLGEAPQKTLEQTRM